MREAFEVPEAYQAAFRRLRRRMPADLQADPAVMETALLYLKMGGEKVAAHRLALFRKQFESECKLFKRRLVDESVDDEDTDGDEDGDNGSDAPSDEDTDD